MRATTRFSNPVATASPARSARCSTRRERDRTSTTVAVTSSSSSANTGARNFAPHSTMGIEVPSSRNRVMRLRPDEANSSCVAWSNHAK